MRKRKPNLFVEDLRLELGKCDTGCRSTLYGLWDALATESDVKWTIAVEYIRGLRPKKSK